MLGVASDLSGYLIISSINCHSVSTVFLLILLKVFDPG